jgi:stringent starvation protein B
MFAVSRSVALGVAAGARAGYLAQSMSQGPRRLPPKKEVALALLEGSSLFIHLDPRRPGVVVPKWFMSEPQLVLQIGLNMAVQIPDLVVDDEGIRCTLSFNRSPFWCQLPWSSVFGLRDEEGRQMTWPDDIPAELLRPAAPPKPRLAVVPPPAPAPATKPRAATKRAAKPKTAPSDEALSPAIKPKRKRAAKPAAPPAARAPAKLRLAPEPEAARPILREVKAGEDDRAKPAARSRRSTPVPVAAPMASDTSEAPEAAPSAKPSGKKPRRELPPYLRIVK